LFAHLRVMVPDCANAGAPVMAAGMAVADKALTKVRRLMPVLISLMKSPLNIEIKLEIEA
jgi:hypothetical protein